MIHAARLALYLALAAALYQLSVAVPLDVVHAYPTLTTLVLFAIMLAAVIAALSLDAWLERRR